MYIGFVHPIVCTTLAKMFPCVSIAPFGVPVVPPVYWRTARSPEVTTGIPTLMLVMLVPGTCLARARHHSGAKRSASASVPSLRGGAADAAEYSAIEVTIIASIVVLD